MGVRGLATFGGKHPVFALVALSAIILLATWRLKEHAKARKYKHPPQIPGIPIFGNTFQLPPLKQGVWAIEMVQKYGEMYVLQFWNVNEQY